MFHESPSESTTDQSLSPEYVDRLQRILGVEPSGVWNDATVAALPEFQTHQGLPPDGRLSDETRAALSAIDRLDDDGSLAQDDPLLFSFSTASSAGDGPPLTELRAWCDANRVELIDYRSLREWPRDKVYPKEYGYPRDKSRSVPPKGGILRDWGNITTFMLHTTSVGGMTAKRGIGIPCHLYLPKENAIVLCHELELLLYHGHSGNSFSVGLEISGVSDWDCPSQIERARALLRYFQAVRRANMPDAACAVMAHRMSHDSRTNDPGPRIWQDAGEWAIAELGYKHGPVVGSGKDVDPWRSKAV